MINIAVVGTGIIGASHLAAISNSNSCRLCAVCDVNEASASAFAAKYAVPYFLDYRDIPRKTEADAVILNLPHWLHCEATVFFLEQGIHVFVEKPMANSLDECRRMQEAALHSGKKLAVGHLQRFVQANRMVKDIVASGELGRLCMVTEFRTIDYFVQNRPKWFLDKKLAGGGIVMNYGAHALDKLYYILQSRPKRICAVTGNSKNDASIEGHAQIFAEFDCGVSATITFCGYTNAGYETVYYFTDGALKVVDTYQLFKRAGREWIPVQSPEADNSMVMQLEEFCKLIRGENSEMPTGEYGADVIAAIECIYKENC